MNLPAPSWDHYASFLSVMRLGSLNAAARDLRLTQPTVRRQIAALETALGAVLFTRSPAGLLPTAAARRMLGLAEEMEATARALQRQAGAGAEAVGTVRLTCSEVVGVEVLPPLLAGLAAEHPGIAVELAPDNATADLMRRDADIAVRMAAPRQPALRARKLGVVPVGLHARADYLARHGVPETLDDLARHRMIGEDRGRAMAAAFAAMGRAAPAFDLRTDSDLAQLALIRAGAGIGFCQTRLAAADGLVRVLPDLGVTLDCWLVMHEDQRDVPVVRTVYDHLGDALQQMLRTGRGGA